MERLVRRTALSLAGITLLLTIALLAGVGLATAAVAIRSADDSVDRSLRDAATAAIAYLELIDVDAVATPAPTLAPSFTPPSTTPAPTAWPTDDNEPAESAAPSEPPGDESEPDGRLPLPVFDAAVARPRIGVAVPTAADLVPLFDLERDDQPPAASDTFFLVLDASGQVLANPRRVLLAGLPDAAAARAAAANGEDWRTVTADGAQVRLFTQRVSDGRGGPPAVLQSGMVLTLHMVQRNELLMTILIASLLGLAGAALVTVAVTRRALAPIRSAFAAERRFVAAASHELRTPVALVHALGEVLQREDLVKPGGRQMVSDLIDETDRLGRLVGDLLALSSAEAGSIDIDLAAVEGRTFATDFYRRISPMAAQRGLTVELQQCTLAAVPKLPLVTDASRLAQLLLILADNAFDHSPAGGHITLSVGRTDRGGPKATFSITDQGPGVPLAERERIFEPFATLRGRGRNGDSTGLGLAIARTLADRLGAHIEVTDADGGGAVFTVGLPLDGKPAIPPRRAAEVTVARDA